ncbi:hypothetical protein [Bacillus sp. HMF5848]|uniref:hypothetical protein n=1 Tax=Bacillus sp. HMF5848 TaxID=2495421 RepID=UPI0021ADE50E|nr:hypothetical protein [Bacillus sp. HMF5848]
MKKNEKLPDFKQLDDRVIAEASPEPTLVIKTNLDSEGVTDHNPYAQDKTSNEFNDFFKER